MFGLVEIISQLESRSKFQMFTLFSGRHIGGPFKGGSPTWWLHARLCNFPRNISTNITISSLYLLNGFCFFYCVIMNTLYSLLLALAGLWSSCFATSSLGACAKIKTLHIKRHKYDRETSSSLRTFAPIATAHL